MKKKLASIVLSVCLALSLLPTAAWATGYDSWEETSSVTF